MSTSDKNQVLAEANTDAMEDHELLRLLIASVVDYGIFMLSPEGIVMSWNDGAHRIKGYAPNEIIGQPFTLFYTEEDIQKDKPASELQKAAEQGRFEDLGWRVRKDKSLFFANVVITALRGKNGELLGYSKVTRDITERLKTEEALRKSEESFRLLVTSVVDYSLIMLGPDGTVLTWNDGATGIDGYTADEIVGHSFSRFYLPEDIKANRPAYELKQATKHGKFENRNWRVRKDGSKFWANVIITALKDQSGHLLGFGKVTRDISEQKEAEEVQIARDAALAASHFKSEFLSNMSHEIRTPMNGIIGMTEILLRSPLNSAQWRYTSAIKDSSKALLSIINDILDFSKIEAGKLCLDIVDVNVVDLVESIAELLAVQANEKNVSLLTFIDPNIPHLLRTDPIRLRQILINIMGNAVKFSPKGNVIVRAMLESNQSALSIKFSVIDSGPGMTAAQITNLFEPFLQGDSSMTRKYGGTGLGLSICKKLVDLMNGRIGVQSAKDFGSTFWFSIPVKTSPLSVDMNTTLHLQEQRILLLADDPFASEIFADYLTFWVLRSSTVVSIDSAMELLTANYETDPFTVALVDLTIDEKEVFAFCKNIRRSTMLQKLNLILHVPYDKPGTTEEALECGFDACIFKPVRQSELFDAISRVVLTPKPKFTIRESEIMPVKVEMEVVTKRPKRPELILIAEDHPINQEVAKLILQEVGFETDVAANGQQVLDLLSKSTYAAILMDCQMPIMSGLEAAQEIRKTEASSGARMPIIAMTAHAVEGSREQCINAGMDDYLSKPISTEQIADMLDKWLPVKQENANARDNLIWLARLHKKYGEQHSERLLTVFREEAPIQIDNLNQAITSQNLSKVVIAARSLAGISQTLLALDLSATAGKIETESHSGNWEKTQQLLAQLQIEFKELLL